MKKLIIANWKMQLSYKESLNLAKRFVAKVPTRYNKVVVCPSHVSLAGVANIFKRKAFSLGAQNCAAENEGAYTGETSPQSLVELKTQYVILGHSERRQYFNETDQIINEKIQVVLQNNLIPLLCIGENLEVKESGGAKKFLRQQLRRGLRGLKIKKNDSLIIAYEPLWAIGTGQAIIPLEAEIIHSFIKKEVAKIIKKKVKVVYGGSVNANNAQDFLSQKNIDGLLIGGASLKVNEFSQICRL